MRRFNPLPVGRSLASSPRQMWAVLGPDARSLLQLPGIEFMQDRIVLTLFDMQSIGPDVRLHYRVRK